MIIPLHSSARAQSLIYRSSTRFHEWLSSARRSSDHFENCARALIARAMNKSNRSRATSARNNFTINFYFLFSLGSRIILFRALVSGTSLYSCLGGLLPDWNCTEPEEKEDDGFEWDGASSGLWLSARSSVVSNGARGHRSATDGGGSGMLKMKT